MTQTPVSATSYVVKVVVAAVAILVLCIILAVFFFIQPQPKIGYIRSKDVVFGYAGT